MEEGIDWGGMAATAVLYVKAWAGVVFSVLLASIILYKAVIDRRSRLEESRVLPYQKSAEQPEDWMGQYQKEADATSTVAPSSPPLEEVPKATYEAMFRHQHGVPETARPAIDSQLVSAASWSSTRGRKRQQERSRPVARRPSIRGGVRTAPGEPSIGPGTCFTGTTFVQRRCQQFSRGRLGILRLAHVGWNR